MSVLQTHPSLTLATTTLSLVFLVGWILAERKKQHRRPSQNNTPPPPPPPPFTPNKYPPQIDIIQELAPPNLTGQTQVQRRQQQQQQTPAPIPIDTKPAAAEQEQAIMPWNLLSSNNVTFPPPRTRASLSSSVEGRKGSSSGSSRSSFAWSEDNGSTESNSGPQQSVALSMGEERLLLGVGEQFLGGRGGE
ncbi:hypothetical protein QBC43DRAFT_5023 [Cladorrhinum sp. PSN259]|nr:hypothetical protein QBC43DRAFT_5023 [Cladorrhinum sp. PSN259]